MAIPVPLLNVAQYLPGGAKYGEDPDVVMIIKRIEDNFARALKQLEEADPGSSQFTQALGKALINDQSLSVNKNLACATCHTDYSGFTGGASFFNATTSALPGSVPITNSDGTRAGLANKCSKTANLRLRTLFSCPSLQ